MIQPVTPPPAGRILALDYGLKRCGLAQTDVLRLSLNPLPPCPTPDLWPRLEQLLQPVGEAATLVMGYPRNLSGQATHTTAPVEALAQAFAARFPHIHLVLWDERLTTRVAQQAQLAGGVPKHKRQDKGRLDSLSAAVLLQNYLQALDLMT